MSDYQSHHQVKIGSERGFGVVFAAFFALIGLLPMLTGSGGLRWWGLLLAAAFGLVALLAPQLLAPLNKLWFKFGLLLGKVIAPLVMSLVYFTTVTPIALLARLVGKDFLHIAPASRQRDSFWIERQADPEHPSSMNNQF